MDHSSVRPADTIETVIRTYGNTLYRLCFVMPGSESDAEDAAQEAFTIGGAECIAPPLM